MQIISLLLDNFTTICLSLGLIIIILTNKNFDKKTNLSFAFFVFILMSLVAMDVTDQVCASLPKPTVLRYVASSLGYVLRPASIAIIVNILLRRNRTNYKLWIPLGFITIISFTSAFTHLMFWFDESNTFMRGPLAFITHICSAVYLVLLLSLIIKKHKKITSNEVYIVLFSAYICVVATVLETVLSDYRFLITGAMAVSFTLYYAVLYAETFKIDQLTGLLNRKSLYADESRMRNRKFSVISVDLNNLKEINDSQGHSAGDEALKRLADILSKNGGKEFCPYRVGGDEFIVLGKELKEEAISQYVEKVRSDLKKENLMASFGYSVSSIDDNFDDVCIKADKLMYEDKRKYKNRINA